MAERVSIAQQVLGIDRPDNAERSISQAMKTLTGRRFSRLSLSALFGERDITNEERSRDLASIRDLLRGNVSRANTLTDWATYTRLLHDYGKPSRGGHAVALLIGAHSALSARSFECLARTEYGADRVLVVDPVSGRDKRRHGTFVHGSGMQLPFKDDSIDFVHTNRLMHMLYGPSAPERPDEANWSFLFGEIGRVAAIGSQVFMKEAVPGVLSCETDVEAMSLVGEFAGFINVSLKRAGFGRGYVGLGGVIAGTGSEADFVKTLFDSHRPMDVATSVHDMSTVEVYAQKLV